jgi:PKD repeat protein
MKKMIALVICLIAILNAQSVVDLVQNPYGSVAWSTYNQYKANYHTHTTLSDGSVAFQTVVNAYNTANYDILAMTDHNVTTWPWPNGVPAGMLGVRGNEFSNSHHDLGLHEFTVTSATLEQAIPNVQTNGGRNIIAHPGRYNTASNWSWYIPWYRDYSTNVGMEVYNQGDRYPTDRALWDNVNTNLFPAEGKMVWGFSNDDMHTTSHYFKNYQFMLMPELTDAAHKQCLDNGAFYFVYEPSGNGTPNVPRISGITVDNTAKTITIAATGYTSISWIGPGTVSVGTGTTFNYSAYTNKAFVRAVLTGSNGTSFTQPFGFTTTVAAPPVADFTANQTTVIFGGTVNFTDASTNGATSWAWTFEGGVPGTSTVENPSVVYPNIGTYQVSLTATNQYGSDTETKTGYITVGNTGSIELSIITGNDDVEQFMSSGVMDFTSTDLEFNDDAGNQQVGLRFQGVNIPQGATITSAYVRIQCDEQDTAVLNHIKYAAEDIDNSPAFTTAAYNLSSRTKTTNIVTWTNPPSWYVGTFYNFPDMSPVVQEVVDRTGWISGNSMTFIFYKTDTDADERCAESYEGGSPPRLYVQFTVPAPVAPGVPSNVTTSVAGTDLVIDWDAASGATSYDVYSSADPYGTFTFEANVATNQYVIPYTDSKKFYYVVSKNATK